LINALKASKWDVSEASQILAFEDEEPPKVYKYKIQLREEREALKKIQEDPF
jgi:hypothetical protein